MAKQAVELNGKTILVTGSPGFIGAHLAARLLKELSSGTVISLDSMNSYYDPALKEYRLRRLEREVQRSPVRHVFLRGNIADKALVMELFEKYRPAVVVNLAAQAGVRYSIEHPDAYIESNIIGFYNILEACRRYPVEHLVYASSSSVYGGNKKVPFSTEDMVDHPISLYAATKKSDELLAHSYAKLYNIPATGLRFFTVYGPAGRPDMFYYSATSRLVAGGTIKIFNYGNCLRDFTYVDDIVEGILRVMQGAPEKAAGEDGEDAGALRGLQHRRRPAGKSAGLRLHAAGRAGARRGAAGGLRFRGAPGAGRHAAGGRARHLCRQRGARARLRLRSAHFHPGRPARLRAVVSGLSYQGKQLIGRSCSYEKSKR